MLRAATELFAEQGYAAASIAEIAKRAGVTTSTVHHHFDNKAAIFIAVMSGSDPTGAVEPPRLDGVATLADGLMTIAGYICDCTFRPRSVNLMRLAIAESPRFPALIMNLHQQAHTRAYEAVAAMFGELSALGLTPRTEPSTTARLFVDLVVGAVTFRVQSRSGAACPTEAELHEKVELFIRGRFSAARRSRVGRHGPKPDSDRENR